MGNYRDECINNILIIKKKIILNKKKYEHLCRSARCDEGLTNLALELNSFRENQLSAMKELLEEEHNELDRLNEELKSLR